MVRIHIREQLCLLILITSLLALMVLAVSTWVQSHHYLQQAREQLLQVTANLKCDQVGQILSLSEESVQSFTNKAAVQSYVSQYDNGNTSQELRDALATSLQTDTLDHVLSSGAEDSVYLQAAVYARDNGSGGDLITQATGTGVRDKFNLGYNYPNGSAVYFGDPVTGYPPSLYPNLTYDGDVASYDLVTLNESSSLLLGPLFLSDVNITLFSITVPIVNDTSESDLLGWLTVVLDGRALYNIIDSEVGLGNTGEVAILGPDRPNNMFNETVEGQPESVIGGLLIQFKLPPYRDRHPKTDKDPLAAFPISDYPLVLAAYTVNNSALNNAGALWSTHNEAGYPIAGGYAIVNSPLVDWVVVFGQTTGEVSGPINAFRNTILACVFSVVGAIIIVCWPLAHYAVKPIRALRSATENSILTYETYAPPSLRSDSGTDRSVHSYGSEEKDANGFILIPKRRKKSTRPPKKVRTFQIPQRVPDKKHFIYDELTDLTSKFNDMSDELNIQYGQLENRVKERTAELEKSRNEAQAANESKTLFIANVSHELRTPLNGIIGMCAVAMAEEDIDPIRQSLKIIYKSSDLLLHLLNDLLTFSRSSYGQQLSIEENTFRLVDVGTQLVSIFEKQAKDADVGLKIVFLGPNSPYPQSEEEPEDSIVARRDIVGNLRRVQTSTLANGPADVGPLREVGLRGDKNRILQILMNLVSNSLKFTPAKGQIEVRIRCRGMCDMTPPSSENSSNTAVPPDTIDAPLVGVPKILFRKASAVPSTQRGSYTSAYPPIKGLVFDFEVEDTGSGIPEHLQKEVFKPFVQGDLALSKKHGGTGLGLAICSQLAELMGGHIRLKSTPEIGSTFTLTLPLLYTKEKVPSVSGSLAISGRRGSATSMSNSIQFETFSDRSGGSRTHRSQAQPLSRQSTSHAAHTPDGELERPRLVGYSQPFILDSNSEDEALKVSGRRSPAFRRSEPVSGSRLQVIASRTESGGTTSGAVIPALPHHDSEPAPEGRTRERITSAQELPTRSAAIESAPLEEVNPGTKAVEAVAPKIAEDPTAVSIPAARAEPVVPAEVAASPAPQAHANITAPLAPVETGTSTTSVVSTEPATPVDGTPSVRILVAEDNAVNQQVILRLLKLEKVADVTLAEDGQLAVEAVQKSLDDPAAGKYTLVFMDIQMPRMDGIEATKKIRAMGFSAPIVALTAFDHETNRKNCEEAGMDAFLPKPIKRTALKKVLADFKPHDSCGDAATIVPGTNSEASSSSTSVEKQIEDGNQGK